MANALSDLATTLGGTTVSTNAGNTGALENALTSLVSSGSGYEELLASIFQQAAGQIPGFQLAYANSVGARGSSANSAITSALEKLLKDTTLAGQSQIAQQEQANLNSQITAGTAIANATKATETTTQTDLGEAAKNLAILKLLNETGLFSKSKTSSGGSAAGGGGGGDAGGSMAIAPSIATSLADTLGSYGASGVSAPAYAAQDSGTAFDINSLFNTDALSSFDFNTSVGSDPGASAPREDINLYAPDIGGDTGGDYIPFDTIPDDYYIDFADGGLVGRKKSNFADGGSVTQTAAGSRLTAADPIVLDPVLTTVADNTIYETPTAVPETTPATAAPVVDPLPGETPEIDLAAYDLTGSSGTYAGGYNVGVGAPSDTTKKAMQVLGALASLDAAYTGDSNLASAASLMSKATNATTNAAAVKAFGTTALNTFANPLGTIVSVLTNPTQANVVDAMASLNPITGVFNMGANIFGDTSIGKLAVGTPQSVDANGNVTEATMGFVGGGGEFGGEPAMSSPVTGYGSITTSDLGSLGSLGSGDGSDSSGSDGSGSDSGGSDSGGGSDGGGAAGGGSVGGDSRGGTRGGMADGGDLEGIKDNMTINVSKGEYVVSDDVVEALGVDFFDYLQQALHTPAAVQRARA